MDRQVLEAVKANPTDIKFIESNEGSVNWSKVISIGLQAEVDRVKRFKALQTYTNSFKQDQKTRKPKPIKPVIRQCLEVEGDVGTFAELVEYLENRGFVVSWKSPNDVKVSTPYYYESKWLLARTDGKFQVNSSGQIRYTSAFYQAH